MRRFLFSLAFALPVLAGAADPLRMEIQPLFEGQEISYGYMALRAEVENDGPPAQGMIVVSGEGQKTIYPVDLPTGARKLIPIFVNLSWNGGNVLLRTDRGNVLKEVQTSGGYEADVQHILMITQTPGELAGLRGLGKVNGRSSGLVRDAYVRPEEAPDRPLAYQGAAAVLLGEGSERLSDDTVIALRNYVMMGGTLVMFGGASAPVLSDTRWSELAPVGNGKVETVGSLTVSKVALEGPLSYVLATPRAGSIVRDRDGRIPTIVERPVGLGRVMFMAVNPTESGESGADVAALIYRSLRLTDGKRGRSVLNTYAAGAGDIASNSSPSDPTNDPFTAQLPAFETIAWILGIFFVVVIPANFLLLRAFKRGEWAWFTAPLISLGFATILFSKARDLYAAKASTYSVGALVAQKGTPEAWFVGETKFFIPSGGTYDLKLKNIDSLGNISTTQDPYSYNSGAGQPELESIDNGRTVSIPQLRANNLAFRSLAYRQAMPDAGEWFTITTKGRPNSDFATFEVRNNSPYTLVHASVMLGENAKRIGDLKPGQVVRGEGKYVRDEPPRSSGASMSEQQRSRALAGAPPAISDPENRSSVGSIGAFSWRTRRPVLTGLVLGLRPGPQIGAELKDRSAVRLLYMGDVR
ncbi:hypothetical protein EON79_00740 [bacterium]|nr:MAG: hypothetical protein EON79_00740 [bacterium]